MSLLVELLLWLLCQYLGLLVVCLMVFSRPKKYKILLDLTYSFFTVRVSKILLLRFFFASKEDFLSIFLDEEMIYSRRGNYCSSHYVNNFVNYYFFWC